MAFDFGAGEVGILPNLKGFLSSLVSQVRPMLSQAGAEGGQSLTAGLQKSFSNLGTVARIGFGALGVAAIAEIDHSIHVFEQAAGEVRKLSMELGVSAQDASKLRFAAGELGISTDQLSTSFGAFSKHLVDGGKAFEKYGITLADAHGKQKSFDVLLGEVSDRFRALPKGPEQAAFAMDLFGRSGRALIPLLQQGSAGFRQLSQEAERLGLVLSPQDVEAAHKAALASKELHFAVQGLQIELGRDYLPIQQFATRAAILFTEALHHIPAPIRSFVAGAVGLGGILVGLSPLLQGAAAGMELLAKAAATRVGGAVKGLFVPLAGLGGPLTIIAAGLAGVAIGAEALARHMPGAGTSAKDMSLQLQGLSAGFDRGRASIGLYLRGLDFFSSGFGKGTLSADQFAQVLQDQLIPAYQRGRISQAQWNDVVGIGNKLGVNVRAALSEAGGAHDALAQATRRDAMSLHDFVALHPALRRQLAATRSSLELLGLSFADGVKARQELASADQKTAAQGTKDWASFTSSLRQDLLTWRSDTATSLNFVASSLQNLTAKPATRHQIADAEDRVRIAQERLNAAIKKGSGSVDSYRLSVRTATEGLHQLRSGSTVTATQIEHDFHRQLRAMTEFGNALETILRRSHGSAKELTAALIQMGPSGVAAAEAIAGANKKSFNDIVGTWNKAEGASNRLAGTLEGQIVGSLRDIRSAVVALARQLAPGFRIRVDSSQARGAVTAFRAFMQQQLGAITVPVGARIYKQQTGPWAQHGGDVSSSGFVRVGERHEETVWLPGGAKVLPLSLDDLARSGGHSRGRPGPMGRLETDVTVDWRRNVWHLQHRIDMDEFVAGH